MLYRTFVSSLLCLVLLSSAEKLESGAQKYWVEEGTAIVTLKVVTSNPGLTVTRTPAIFKVASATVFNQLNQLYYNNNYSTSRTISNAKLVFWRLQILTTVSEGRMVPAERFYLQDREVYKVPDIPRWKVTDNLVHHRRRSRSVFCHGQYICFVFFMR